MQQYNDGHVHVHTYYTHSRRCFRFSGPDVLHITHCTCSCEDGIGTTQFHVLYVQLLEFMCLQNTHPHINCNQSDPGGSLRITQHPHMVMHNMLHSTHQVPEVSSVSINFIKLVWNRSDLQRRQKIRPNHLCTLIL